MNQKRIYIFDLDGTLVDSSSVIQNTILDYLGDYSESTKRIVRERFKESPYDILKAFKTSVDWHRYWELYEKYFSENLEQFPDVAIVLKELKDTGNQLAIFSSMKRKYVHAIAKLFEVPFVKIIAYEDPFGKKPDPSAILEIIRLCRADSRNPIDAAIYVGDTEKDILTGKNAKIETGLAEWGLEADEINTILKKITPDFSFKNPRDMIDI